MIPLEPAYSAPLFRISVTHADAWSGVEPLGTVPPNTRMWPAPSFCATSTHLRSSDNSLSRSAPGGLHISVRTEML